MLYDRTVHPGDWSIVRRADEAGCVSYFEGIECFRNEELLSGFI